MAKAKQTESNRQLDSADVQMLPVSPSASAGIAAPAQIELRTSRRLVDKPIPTDGAGDLIANLRGLLLAEGDRDSQAIALNTTDEDWSRLQQNMASQSFCSFSPRRL